MSLFCRFNRYRLNRTTDNWHGRTMTGKRRRNEARGEGEGSSKEKKIKLVEEKAAKLRKEGRIKNLRLSVLNVNGFDDVSQTETKEYMKSRRPDVMGLVETKLREDQLDEEELDVEGYDRFEVRRSDLAGDTAGGGIMIYARSKEGLQFQELKTAKLPKEKQFAETERKWLVVKTEQYETAVCVVYLSHQTSNDKYGAQNEMLLEVLRKEIGVIRAKGMRVIIMGDMNAWVGCEEGVGIPGNRQQVNKNGERFISFLKDTKMMHLNGASRKVEGEEVRLSQGLFTRHDARSATAIDFICVSREHQKSIRNLRVDENGIWGGNSDHVILESNFEDAFVRRDTKNNNTKGKPKWDFDDKTDWSDFKKILDEHLENIENLNENDVDALGEKLVECLVRSLKDAFGDKKKNRRKAKQFPPDVLIEIKKKKEVKAEWRENRSKLSRNPDDTDLKERNEVLLKRLEERGESLDEKMVGFWTGNRRKLLDELSQKTVSANKKFWSYFRAVSKAPAGITVVEDPQTGELLDDPEEVRGCVQKFLITLFEGSLEVPAKAATDNDMGFDEEGETGEGKVLSEESEKELENPFQEEEIEFAIKQLQNEKAEGVDRIPQEALKNATPKFVSLLNKLFNKVKVTGNAPDCWKTGRVVILLKSRPKEELGNYRPLTVIVAIAGLFSRVLNQRLTRVVERENFLGEVQQGFRKSRSGSDNSFVLNTILWKAGAMRKKAHLAFVDLKKAYDTVLRQKLWASLRKRGIKGSFLSCLQSLYSGDRFVTQVNGEWTSPI